MQERHDGIFNFVVYKNVNKILKLIFQAGPAQTSVGYINAWHLRTAASLVRYSAFFGGSAKPAQHTRSTGLICGQRDALELYQTAWKIQILAGTINFRRLLKTH